MTQRSYAGGRQHAVAAARRDETGGRRQLDDERGVRDVGPERPDQRGEVAGREAAGAQRPERGVLERAGDQVDVVEQAERGTGRGPVDEGRRAASGRSARGLPGDGSGVRRPSRSRSATSRGSTTVSPSRERSSRAASRAPTGLRGAAPPARSAWRATPVGDQSEPVEQRPHGRGAGGQGRVDLGGLERLPRRARPARAGAARTPRARCAPGAARRRRPRPARAPAARRPRRRPRRCRRRRGPRGRSSVVGSGRAASASATSRCQASRSSSARAVEAEVVAREASSDRSRGIGTVRSGRVRQQRLDGVDGPAAQTLGEGSGTRGRGHASAPGIRGRAGARPGGRGRDSPCQTTRSVTPSRTQQIAADQQADEAPPRVAVEHGAEEPHDARRRRRRPAAMRNGMRTARCATFTRVDRNTATISRPGPAGRRGRRRRGQMHSPGVAASTTCLASTRPGCCGSPYVVGGGANHSGVPGDGVGRVRVRR